MVSRAIFEVEAMLERFSRVKRMLKTMRPVSIFYFEVLATFWTVFANFFGKNPNLGRFLRYECLHISFLAQ